MMTTSYLPPYAIILHSHFTLNHNIPLYTTVQMQPGFNTLLVHCLHHRSTSQEPLVEPAAALLHNTAACLHTTARHTAPHCTTCCTLHRNARPRLLSYTVPGGSSPLLLGHAVPVSRTHIGHKECARRIVAHTLAALHQSHRV